MVRNITGTLVDLGLGKIEIDDIPGIFVQKDRRAAGRTAPARGLSLVKIYFGDPPQDIDVKRGEVFGFDVGHG